MYKIKHFKSWFEKSLKIMKKCFAQTPTMLTFFQADFGWIFNGFSMHVKIDFRNWFLGFFQNFGYPNEAIRGSKRSSKTCFYRYLREHCCWSPSLKDFKAIFAQKRIHIKEVLITFNLKVKRQGLNYNQFKNLVSIDDVVQK